MSSPINNNCRKEIDCPTRVCVPVSVTPYAEQGTTTAVCCGPPVITYGTPCSGVENGSCNFTVTQNINVSIPIEFGANSFMGSPFVECQLAPLDNSDSSNCPEINRQDTDQLRDMLV
ncbi:MAG TPA: hypothetical protein VFC96_00085 [Anaerovoracaceae bacterium]|nr:hypothetical protein [Anaerovoracaceae bacterium]